MTLLQSGCGLVGGFADENSAVRLEYWHLRMEWSSPRARAEKQGVIRYHPALARKEGREKRKTMAVLEINDWDDSVTSCRRSSLGREIADKGPN